MEYNDDTFGRIFPTRTGNAQGAAIERTMLDKVGGSAGFRTVVRKNPDGSTTRCRTNNGMPRFETFGKATTSQADCGWSFTYHPIKQVDGVLTPDTIAFGEHTVPQMSTTAGMKGRRRGVVKAVMDGQEGSTAVIGCGESEYEGVSERSSRIHGSHYWYSGTQVVSWTKRTYVPIENPTTGLPKWVPVGVVRYGSREIEVFEIGGGEEEALLTVLAACLVSSPDGTKHIRVAIARQNSALNPIQSINVKDYTLIGQFVSEKRIEEGVYLHNIVEGFSPAAWSPNGLSLIVGTPVEDDSVARIYNVSRPDDGLTPDSSYTLYSSDVSQPDEPTQSTSVTTTGGVPEESSSGNLRNRAPDQFEVMFYSSTFDRTTNTTTVYLDISYEPYAHKSKNTTTTTTVLTDGRSDMWPESVGFTKDGHPCVVIGTERIEGSTNKVQITHVEVSDTYGNPRVEEQIQDFGTYVDTKRWIICDSLKQILDGAYTTINETTVVFVDRDIYLTVGGATVWHNAHNGSFSTTKTSNFSHEYYLEHVYEKEPIPLTTTRRGERVDDITVTTTPAIHMSLNNIASDFVDGYVAVYSHGNIEEPPTVRTQTNSYDNRTEQIRYRLTGETVITEYGGDPVVTDVSEKTGELPDLISASITVVETTGGIVGSTYFSWPNSGVSGYRSYFDGTAAWCPYRDSLLAIARRPSSPYVGLMFTLGEGWVSAAINPLEPSVSYGPNASTMFDFTKLSPFA